MYENEVMADSDMPIPDSVENDSSEKNSLEVDNVEEITRIIEGVCNYLQNSNNNIWVSFTMAEVSEKKACFW